MESLQGPNTSTNLKTSIQEIIASNNISLDSPWRSYEVLTAALKQGNRDVANELLDIGCLVNQDVKSIEPCNTPLHYAVIQEDVQLVKKLLKKGASITAIDSDANTPLHLAFVLKHYEIVDLMLLHIEETSSYDDMANTDGLSHLHIACARGKARLVYSFKYVGADINRMVSKAAQEYPGYTCLQFACDSKCLDTIKVVSRAIKLLGNCPKKNKDRFCDTKSSHHWGRITILMDPLSEFQIVCFDGVIDEVREFIETGEDVNSRMTEDALASPLYTPMHFAVEAAKNRQKVVELLLAHGADVNLKNGFCMTPLHSALYSDRYRQAKCFTDINPQQDNALKVIYEAVKDKESNPMDPFGLTYFHAAVALNDMKTVKKFMDAGQVDCKPILPNLRNFSMWTPLHFAVKYGHEDMAELLIQRGADVNANEDQNRFETPLQVATNYGHSRMVDLLLARGANAKFVPYVGGKTMLHHLVGCFGDYEDEKPELLRLVDTFIRCGVDVNAEDRFKRTPLHEACRKIDEKFEIVDELLKLGADINAVDENNDVAFDEADRTDSKARPEVLLRLYYHVQKVKQLGLKIDLKNEEFCERIMTGKEEWQKSDDWPVIERICSGDELSRRQQVWIQEIEKLKIDIVNDKVSLYDYLKMETKEAADFSRNERIEKLVADRELRRVYPAYGYLIPVTHRKSLHWLEPQRPTKKRRIQDDPLDRVGKLV